jgi:hypothetical protein
VSLQLDAFRTFDPAAHRALQRTADREGVCWRSDHAGHNAVCLCQCPACRYERDSLGMDEHEPLSPRPA